ncbi:MAG: CRISPR-associated endonuclease Cas2 [Cyanobacteriota bacterium]
MSEDEKQLKLDIKLEDDNSLPPTGDNWLLGRQDNSLPFEEEEVLTKLANRTFLILIIYDIVDNKKRTKLAKKLLGYGERVQLSAFECHLTLKKYQEMIENILPYVDEEVDLLRIYRMTGQADLKIWGHIRETYDEDVVII